MIACLNYLEPSGRLRLPAQPFESQPTQVRKATWCAASTRPTHQRPRILRRLNVQFTPASFTPAIRINTNK